MSWLNDLPKPQPEPVLHQATPATMTTTATSTATSTTTTSTAPMERYKVIHCFLPMGRAVEVMEKVRTEKGIHSTFHHHALGGGTSSRKGRESFHFLEREIATLLVPESRADEIFEYLYFAAGLNQPHTGMVLMEKTLMARAMCMPEDSPS
jgi:hypothetical protein